MEPTSKQLTYLRKLALSTGETFATPATREDASREITRLSRRKASSRTEVRLDRDAVSKGLTERVGDAASVRASEVTGHGSSARWNRDEPAKRRESRRTGELTELARYTTPEGERAVCGRRVEGVVLVVDRPVGDSGRTYLIERGLTSNAELQALVGDYVAESIRRGEPAAVTQVGEELAKGGPR